MSSLLDPLNWPLIYGPQELGNWNERLSIYQQLSGRCYQEDKDLMDYESIDVI